MTKFVRPKILKYSIYPEFNGTLIPFYTNKHFPKKFRLKRFFILYGKRKYLRADHAHRKCSQIIIPLKGQIKIKIKSKNFSKSFSLNVKKRKALLIPPYNWITIYFKENQDSLLTLCDYKYDKKEYISLYKDFKKIISK